MMVCYNMIEVIFVTNYKIKINAISCSNCAQTIISALQKEFPESEVRVNVASKLLLITTNASKSQVEDVLVKINYVPDSRITRKQEQRIRTELMISIVISIYFLIGMAHHTGLMDVPMFFVNSYVQLILATFVQFYIARNFYKNAYQGLKNKTLGMDFLIVFSTTLTYLFSVYLLIFNSDIHPYFETSTIIITIILIGKAIEEHAKSKANSLIDEASKLLDNLVTLETGEQVPAQNVNVGTNIIIEANQKIAIDCIIVKGQSSVDESAMTGESRLIPKAEDDELLAGSINVEQRVIAKTTVFQEESYLYKILDSVESSASVSTKYQRVADSVARVFVPAIIVIGILTFVLTFIFTNDPLLGFERAMSVIVVSCPCSLGLATPTSILVSNSISAKLGILYKEGQFFELANQIEMMAFDKTGTLTLGKPQVVENTIEEDYIAYLYDMCLKSSHPISGAVRDEIGKLDIELDLNVTQIPGIGLEAKSGNDIYQFGNRQLLEDSSLQKQIANLEEQGYTVNVFVVNGQFRGYVKLVDKLRDDAKLLIEKLQSSGIDIAMITGDNRAVAQIIAKQLGIETVYAETKPDQKMEIINQLKTKYKVVAFVGDGINDGASLKAADVGISVAKGSDIAKAASDMTIVKDNLGLILDGIKLSDVTRKNIRHSLMWAFSYNLIAIPLAAFGYLDMIWAAIFMGFSSIVVVLNSLHLKREFKKEQL